jgi:hypothetical protein
MRVFLLVPFLLAGCAHLDTAKLESWAEAKARQVAQCAAESLATERDLERCLGEFVADLGTPACEAAEELRTEVKIQGLEREVIK